MVLPESIKEKLLSEIRYSASRNSGPGGQNVNKVNTKVELRFIFERQIPDLEFIAISPHIAAFLIVFPIPFIPVLSWQNKLPSLLLNWVAGFSCFATD